MNNIKELRLEAKLSQKALAKLAGCSEASIVRYESGKRIMRITTARKIAEVLHVTLGQLLGDEPIEIGGNQEENMNKKLIELLELVYDYNEQNKATGKDMKFSISVITGEHAFNVSQFTLINTYKKIDDDTFILATHTHDVKTIGQAFNHEDEYIQSAIDKVREMLEVK